MALDLVRQNVDVILASGGDNPIKAVMAATTTPRSNGPRPRCASWIDFELKNLFSDVGWRIKTT